MATFTEVPNEKNSAIVVADVVSMLPENWPSPPSPVGEPNPPPTGAKEAFDRLNTMADNVRLDDATAETLRSELKEYEEAVGIARTVANYDRGRHELELGPILFNTRLPETQAARTVARFLSADAAIRAHGGDFDGALDSCRAILGVARSIGDEPFLIGQLVRLAISSVAISSVAISSVAIRSARRTIGQGEPTDDAIARLQALVLDELVQPLLLYGLEGNGPCNTS